MVCRVWCGMYGIKTGALIEFSGCVCCVGVVCRPVDVYEECMLVWFWGESACALECTVEGGRVR